MSASDATQRLFYALWPTAAERERTARAAAGLPIADGARLVPPQNYHLTIAFVGDVPAAQVERLRKVGGAQACARFALSFDAYEYWPKPEVVVAAARATPAGLDALWRELHDELARAGFVLEPKRLRPHVTLARRVAAAPSLPALPAFAWKAAALCLVRSQTEAAAAVYTVVDHWPLLDETPNA